MTLTTKEKATIVAKAYKWSSETAELDGFAGHEFDTAPGFLSMKKFWEDDLVDVDTRGLPFLDAKCLVIDNVFSIYEVGCFTIHEPGLYLRNGFIIKPNVEPCLAYTGDPSTLVIPSLTYEQMEREVETINPRDNVPPREAIVDGRVITEY